MYTPETPQFYYIKVVDVFRAGIYKILMSLKQL